MALVIPIADLQLSPTAALFEGRRHADVDVSSFITAYPHGAGPSLHKHPYSEVFVVQEGQATFTAGDDELVVEGGNVVVVGPETPHGFKNSGEGTLRVVSIHPSGEVKQTNLAD
jgi:mannose-6-phosphate isomerase-like protein (cupin superfamily)